MRTLHLWIRRMRQYPGRPRSLLLVRPGRSGDNRHARRTWIRLLTVFAFFLTCTGAEPQTTTVPQPKPLDLKVPAAAVVLMGGKCLTDGCWLSSFFAPAILSDSNAPIALTNTSDRDVTVSARFLGTNGLGLAKLGPRLTLADAGAAAHNLLAATNPPSIAIRRGETALLRLALLPGLSPGSYGGEIRLDVTAATGDPVSKSVTLTAKVRTSVVWVILAALLGILVGRIAQLVYDPKMILRVETFDWLNELAVRTAGIADPVIRKRFTDQLAGLRERLFERNVDTAALRTEIQTLEGQIGTALAGPLQQQDDLPPPKPKLSADVPALLARGWGAVGKVLRILAGVTPLPLPSVYGWLLPFFVLFTLAALTVVFVIQQYGSGSTAETFGAGGIVDFAAIFLAGVASDAIAGGLRNVKLR